MILKSTKRFISAILAVSTRLILWLDVDLNNHDPRPILGWNDGCHKDMGRAILFLVVVNVRSLKTTYRSTLVPRRRKRNERLLVYYKVIFLLTLPFSQMEQLVMSCASFDRITKIFLFHSFLSDSFARRALWQDGLGKLTFAVFA